MSVGNLNNDLTALEFSEVLPCHVTCKVREYAASTSFHDVLCMIFVYFLFHLISSRMIS